MSGEPDAPRAMVLGGTGFFGSHVCAALAHAGYDVVSVARGHAPGVRSLSVDLANATPDTIAALCAQQRPDLVVNSVGAVWSGDTAAMDVLNDAFVTRLLAGLARLPWRPRLVQLGTVHEYGAGAAGQDITETAPTRPTTPYGRTKLRATEAVLAAVAAERVAGVVLRVANVLGARVPTASLPGLVARELAQARESGRTAELRLAPLRAERDFVAARDAADAVLRCATAPVIGELINIGSGVTVPVRSIVDGLVAISGVPADVIEAGEQDATRSRRNDWQRMAVGHAAAVLGWTPRTALRDSLADVWQAATRTVAVS